MDSCCKLHCKKVLDRNSFPMKSPYYKAQDPNTKPGIPNPKQAVMAVVGPEAPLNAGDPHKHIKLTFIKLTFIKLTPH